MIYNICTFFFEANSHMWIAACRKYALARGMVICFYSFIFTRRLTIRHNTAGLIVGCASCKHRNKILQMDTDGTSSLFGLWSEAWE